MDERIKESISALMDDEVNELELQRVLTHVDHESLKKQWQDYHSVRDALNIDATSSSEHSLLSIDVSQSVSEWIESEDDPSSEMLVEEASQNSTQSMARVSGLLAIAASTVFAVLFVFQNGTDTSNSQLPLVADAEVAVEAGISELNSQTVAASREPKIIDHINEDHARRLNQYLLRHAEHSMLGSRQGAMPFVRVASVNSVGI